MITNLVTASFGHESFFTQHKQNSPLIKHFGPMYIDFDEYPRYSGRNSSGKHKMCTWVNEES